MVKPLPKPQFSAPQTDLKLLPPQVARIRSKILEVARAGDVEKLRSPIEWNELQPMFDLAKAGAEHLTPGLDPIKFLKSLSFDKNGAEILRILIAVFEAPFCQMSQGKYLSYVWPAFAFAPPVAVADDEKINQIRCLRFVDLGKSGEDGRPPYYRANIGADGTWHWFWTRSL